MSVQRFDTIDTSMNQQRLYDVAVSTKYPNTRRTRQHFSRLVHFYSAVSSSLCWYRKHTSVNSSFRRRPPESQKWENRGEESMCLSKTILNSK